MNVQSVLANARAGDRQSLARLLTMVESGGAEAREIESSIDLGANGAFTIGVTGAPGAGKSTLVGALLRHANALKERIAVLAVDPSSPFSRGALLGDRVRMGNSPAERELSFIRSMATRGQHGGLAAAAQVSVALFAECGWPWVFLETVGTGQVEIDVAAAADLTVVVLNPGWGDEIQAHKAGIMEIGDLFVINKADRPGTEETRRHLAMLLATRPNGPETIPIIETIATRNEGIDSLWTQVARIRAADSSAPMRRRRRLKHLLLSSLRADFQRQLNAFADSDACEELVGRMDSKHDGISSIVRKLSPQLVYRD